MNNLACTYYQLGDLEKAAEMFEKVYALFCKILGEEHPDTLSVQNNLASILGMLFLNKFLK
ncbi:MAG: tetratricopeptide repeat protein [Clostridia bacterium]|nr:tetratricopeptide repeat protein [Clostridia bacterium]